MDCFCSFIRSTVRYQGDENERSFYRTDRPAVDRQHGAGGCGGGSAPAEAPAEEAVATEAPAEEAAAEEAPAEEVADANALPRNETLYFNGQQWGPVVGWNPYSGSNNNGMAISQSDNACVTMFETPYLYNMLDGQQYPLLAEGVVVVERRDDGDHLQAQSGCQVEPTARR
jgi:hypothetical protein